MYKVVYVKCFKGYLLKFHFVNLILKSIDNAVGNVSQNGKNLLDYVKVIVPWQRPLQKRQTLFFF